MALTYFKRDLWYLRRMPKILLSEAEHHNNKLRMWNVAYTLLSEKIAIYQDQQASRLLEELVNNFMLRNSLYYQLPPRLASVITELGSGQNHFTPHGLGVQLNIC